MKGRAEIDWRDQVKQSVAKHREKKRRELDKRDYDSRQLSIFPEDRPVEVEDEPAKAARQRRAEIRTRVEERLARRPVAPPPSRVVDAGELPLGRGHAAAAVARDLASEPQDRYDGYDEPDEQNEHDPRTVEVELERELDRHPIDESSPRRGRALAVSGLGEEGDALADPTADALGAFGLASAAERVFSGFIDLAFVALIQLTLFYLTTHLVSQRMGALPQSALMSMALVGAVLAAGYFLFFWSLSGQTLGKLLTGSRVVSTRGGTLGLGRSALRLVAVLVAALPLGAGFIGLLTDSGRRGWHDRIAGTKVIRG
jgi:uncharacterized RDD family membrane protein YckC